MKSKEQYKILSVENISKIYETQGKELCVLDQINFSVSFGEVCSIVGPSGSGKTTLLGLCAGLDNPSSGRIYLDGQDLTLLNEDEKAWIRNQKTGFIFQNFQLLPTLSALENTMLPMEIQRRSKDAEKKARHLLERVGLGNRMHHYPSQLSGGEQQRVSLARAFSGDPQILFADEPTGNLDDETGLMVEKLLFQLNKEQNTTLIIVTHNMELAGKTERIIRLKGGKIESDQSTIALKLTSQS